MSKVFACGATCGSSGRHLSNQRFWQWSEKRLANQGQATSFALIMLLPVLVHHKTARPLAFIGSGLWVWLNGAVFVAT